MGRGVKGCSRPILAPSAPSALLPHRGTKGAHLLPPMGADDHAKHGPVGGCGLSDFHPFQKPQASACEPPFLMGVRATRPQHNQRLIPPSDGAIQNRRILRKTTLTMLPPRREERAHGQRPFAAAGGGRAGTGSRGILGRSGDLVAGQTRPPSAWSRERVRPSSIAGRCRTRKRPGPGKARTGPPSRDAGG